MAIKYFARQLTKSILDAGKPTIPASNDHKDGSWTIRDLYESELVVVKDTDTLSRLYTRIGSEIVELAAKENVLLFRQGTTQDAAAQMSVGGDGNLIVVNKTATAIELIDTENIELGTILTFAFTSTFGQLIKHNVAAVGNYAPIWLQEKADYTTTRENEVLKLQLVEVAGVKQWRSIGLLAGGSGSGLWVTDDYGINSNNQRVAIGQETPNNSDELTVLGDVTFNDSVLLLNRTDGVPINGIIASVDYLTESLTFNLGVNKALNLVEFAVSSSDNLENFALKTGGSGVLDLFLTPDGKFGFGGKEDPTELIDIKGSLTLNTPDEANVTDIFYKIDDNKRWGISRTTDAETGSNVGSNLSIARYDDAGNFIDTPFFINRASGNVGVKTTQPQFDLSVEHANGDSDWAIAAHTVGRTNYAGIYFSGSNDSSLLMRDSTGANKVQINTNGDSYMNGGNVGIGTTTPFTGSGRNLEVVSNVTARVLVTNTGTGGTRFGMYSGSSKAAGLFDYTNSREILVYDTDGRVALLAPTVRNRTTPNSSNVYIATDGEFQTSTSSKKIKYDIASYNELSALDLQPVTFKGKADNKDYIGFIAEDVAEVDTRFASNLDTELPGLEINAILAAAVATIKNLNERILTLENK